MNIRAFLQSAALLAALGALVALAAVYSGVVHVGADRPHLPGVRWVLETARDRSIASHPVTDAPNLADFQHPETLRNGLRRYHDTCLPCHGAPGVEPHPFAKGLRPAPPKLHTSDRSPEEVHWIVRHGLRMSAMPSFLASHDELAVAEMAAFAISLQGMKPEEYARQAEAALPLLHQSHDQSPDKGKDHQKDAQAAEDGTRR